MQTRRDWSGAFLSPVCRAATRWGRSCVSPLCDGASQALTATRASQLRRVTALLLAVCATTTLLGQTPADALLDLDDAKVDRANLPKLAAVAMSSRTWKHGETTNFIYHFTERTLAVGVATEAEFFYRVIARELERDTTQWERKAHIFLFESDAEWKAFEALGLLDPRSGGIHSAGALFLKRRGAPVMNDETLAHEIAHLVVGRFFGSGVSLWLNEGFAENSAIRCRSAFFRARGYDAKPRFRAVSAETYIPLSELTSLATYPTDTVKLLAFYDESEKLTRFLMTTDRKAFAAFMDALAKGNRFDTALAKAYGARFVNFDAMEREFKPFATSNVVPSNP